MDLNLSVLLQGVPTNLFNAHSTQQTIFLPKAGDHGDRSNNREAVILSDKLNTHMAHPERPHLHLVPTEPTAESRAEYKLQLIGAQLLAATHAYMSVTEPDERERFTAKDAIIRLSDATEIYIVTNDPHPDVMPAPKRSAG